MILTVVTTAKRLSSNIALYEATGFSGVILAWCRRSVLDIVGAPLSQKRPVVANARLGGAMVWVTGRDWSNEGPATDLFSYLVRYRSLVPLGGHI